MEPIMLTIRNLEIIGFFFIGIVGSILHFAFAWSGNWTPLAIFAAVNESVWEHLKLAFWPAVLWAQVELTLISHLDWRHFWAAKGLSFLAMPLTIVVVFYGYTAILGRNLLFLDIGTFFLAIAVGQKVFGWLFKNQFVSRCWIALGFLLLGGQLLAYSLLTYHAPDFPIFTDQRNGLRAILPAKEALNTTVHGS